MTSTRSFSPPGLWQRRHRMLGYGFLAGALLLGLAGFPASGPALLMLAGALSYAALLSTGRRATCLALWALAVAAILCALWLMPFDRPVSVHQQPLAVTGMAQFTAIAAVYLWHFVFIPPARLRVLAAGLLFLLVLWWAATLLQAPLGVFGLVLISLAIGLAGLERGRARWIRQDHQRKASLSVMVICKNEADRIATCLEQVSDWADEIVVVDSGSEDGTLEIVRRYTDRIWELEWHGYGRQKQLALERCSGDWVLSIDADERVTAELRREIDAWLSQPCSNAGFRIAWVSEVFGKYVFFGADGRYHCRLFRRAGARFNDADVHEDVCLAPGRIIPLGAPVCHLTFRDYAHLKEKMTAYALISARRIARRRQVGPVGAWARMLISFAVLYVRRLGMLDGRRGLLMATAYSIYTFDKYAAAWAQRASDPEDGPSSGES